jgi:cysteine desulfuration protein SufE
MSLEIKQKQRIEDLNLLPDPQERLTALVAAADEFQLPEDQRVEELIVQGCQSRVWLKGSLVEGRTLFQSAADSPLVAGLVAELCRLYSGEYPSQVVGVEPVLWKDCGLEKLLSPTRLRGLEAVRQRIAQWAGQWST